MIYYDWICMHTCILPLRLPSCSKSMHEIQIQRSWPLWVQKPSIRPCLQNGAPITPACCSHWGFDKVLSSRWLFRAVRVFKRYSRETDLIESCLGPSQIYHSWILINPYQTMQKWLHSGGFSAKRRHFLSRRFRPTRPPPLCWEATVRWHCISQTASAH